MSIIHKLSKSTAFLDVGPKPIEERWSTALMLQEKLTHTLNQFHPRTSLNEYSTLRKLWASTYISLSKAGRTIKHMLSPQTYQLPEVIEEQVTSRIESMDRALLGQRPLYECLEAWADGWAEHLASSGYLGQRPP